MNLDDEIRRRLQSAADMAGAGVDPSALAAAVSAQAGASTAAGAGLIKLLGGLGVGGLAVGAAVGFTVLRPDDSPTADDAAAVIDVRDVTLFDCPGGVAVGQVSAGDRVYVVGQDADGGWLAVRDLDTDLNPGDPAGDGSTGDEPTGRAATRWIPTDAVIADQGADRDVPVLTCTDTIALAPAGDTPAPTEPTTSVVDTTVETPVPTTPTTPPPTPQPTSPPTVPPTVPPTPPPTAPPDAIPPILSGQTTNSAENPPAVYAPNPGCNPTQLTMTVTATDNVGVTSVTATFVQPGTSKQVSVVFTRVGTSNNWTATFGPFSGLPFSYNAATQVSIRARDAANNVSLPAVLSIDVFGDCLI